MVDHVTLLVPDGMAAAERFRREHGLGSERGMFYPSAGTRHYTIPLAFPQYLEFVEIEDREVAARTENGKWVLSLEAQNRKFVQWAVLVDDLPATAKRLARPVEKYTVPHGDGTLRGWHIVNGADALPFFIDYPNNGDRASRWRQKYTAAKHTCKPGRITALTVGNSESELTEWLGPHDLPLEYASGYDGLHAIRIETADGELCIE